VYEGPGRGDPAAASEIASRCRFLGGHQPPVHNKQPPARGVRAQLATAEESGLGLERLRRACDRLPFSGGWCWDAQEAFANPAAKEVLRYRQALRGWGLSRCVPAGC